MTAELRVSVPDDVADWLKQQADVAAAVTEAVRAWIRTRQIEELLHAAGMDPLGPGDRWTRAVPGPSPGFAEGRRMLADRG